MNYDLKRWEFNALLLESVLLAAAIMGFLPVLGMRVPAPTPPRVSEFLWRALAFAGGGLCLLPPLTAEARNTHGYVVSIGRRIAWIFVGGLIGAGVLYLLR